MARIAGLTGNSGSDQFGGLAQILSQLIELQGGGGSGTSPSPSPTQGSPQTAAPSAAPVGKPTATAGVTNLPTPTPPGAPSVDNTLRRSGVNPSRFSLDGREAPGTDLSGFQSDADIPLRTGGTQPTQPTGGGPGTPTSTPPPNDRSQRSSGELGGLINSISDAVQDTVGMFSMDENEKHTRAQRNILEQQWEIRNQFQAAYNSYFLPAQLEASNYAEQQIGKKSDNYDYIETALKGYIEGHTGVYGGGQEWDDVWNDIAGDLEEVEAPPEDWMGSFQEHFENDTVPWLPRATTTQILTKLFPSMTPQAASKWGLLLTRFGSAMLNASRDTRNGNMEDMNSGSI